MRSTGDGRMMYRRVVSLGKLPPSSVCIKREGMLLNGYKEFQTDLLNPD